METQTFRLVRQEDHFEACVQIRIRIAELTQQLKNLTDPEIIAQWTARLEQLNQLLRSLNAAEVIVE